MHLEKKSALSTAGRLLAVLVVTACAALAATGAGYTYPQTISSSVFTMIIVSTLCFWDFHLPIAFVGIALLMLFGVMDIQRLVMQSHLDVILFLVGMMIIVGILRQLGLFSWLIISILSSDAMTARRFVVTFCALGALMSCMVDEVSSIVFLCALVFQVCDTLNIKPIPFVIMAVVCVNIGSAGTMLGNPVGILIGQNANPPLSFLDFMRWSFPLMLAEFVVALVFLLWTFRREIRAMDEEMTKRRDVGLRLGPMVDVPYGRALAILVMLMTILSVHTFIEDALGLPRNTVLILTPLLLSGLLMFRRREHIRQYIESDVQWVTLIFFMTLFVVAGTLDYTGVSSNLAHSLRTAFGEGEAALLPVTLFISAFGSAFIENVVFVAASLPIVDELGDTALLWALLHGACLGGNITMFGSTANIVAVSMLERRYWTKINFWLWLRTGLAVSILSLTVAWAALTIQSPSMPRGERVAETESR